MTTVTDLQQRLKKLDIHFEAEEAMNNTADDILSKQKDQLLHGVRADGSMIGKYKSQVYAAKKHAMNPLPGFGNMDWKLTGDLHKALFVDVRRDIFVIDSADSKTGSLIQRFGDPMGLTKQSQSDYMEQRLQPQFMQQVRIVTGL